MVPDALVVAGDEGQLHGWLQRQGGVVVGLEHGFDELSLELIEAVVDVVEGGAQGTVVVDVGVDG